MIVNNEQCINPLNCDYNLVTNKIFPMRKPYAYFFMNVIDPYHNEEKALHLITAFLGLTLAAGAADIHVSTKGHDANKGEVGAPLKTLSAAQNAVRELKKEGMPDDGITVYLHGGTYHLDQTLRLTPEDSGSKAKPVIWKAYKNEQPVISGGALVTGWTPDTNGIWKTKLDSCSFKKKPARLESCFLVEMVP